MQPITSEKIEGMESVVSALLGVTSAHVRQADDGSLHSLTVLIAPGHSPDRIRHEVPGAIWDALKIDVDPARVNIHVEDQSGERQARFWQRPERRDREERREWEDRREGDDRRASKGRKLAEEGPEAGDSREGARIESGGRRAGGHDSARRGDSIGAAFPLSPGVTFPGPVGPSTTAPSGHDEPRSEQKPAAVANGAESDGTPEAPPSPASEVSRRPSEQDESDQVVGSELRITKFLIRGATEEGVGLRVHVSAAGGDHAGETRVSSLEHITPGVFVGATLLAAERALDTLPVEERSSRILILEPADMEVMELRRGPKVAVTVRAILRDGEILATGITSVTEEVGLRVAAARAALEAVQRIKDRRDAPSDDVRADGGDIREGPRTIRGFGSGKGRGRGHGSQRHGSHDEGHGHGGTGPADWSIDEQDPFYSWD